MWIAVNNHPLVGNSVLSTTGNATRGFEKRASGVERIIDVTKSK